MRLTSDSASAWFGLGATLIVLGFLGVTAGGCNWILDNESLDRVGDAVVKDAGSKPDADVGDPDDAGEPDAGDPPDAGPGRDGASTCVLDESRLDRCVLM